MGTCKLREIKSLSTFFSVKLQKLTLMLLWQKFRETYFFTKEISKELIWRNIFGDIFDITVIKVTCIHEKFFKQMKVRCMQWIIKISWNHCFYWRIFLLNWRKNWVISTFSRLQKNVLTVSLCKIMEHLLSRKSFFVKSINQIITFTKFFSKKSKSKFP